MEELKACKIFLSQHVAMDSTCDIQCMLLWSEWVRFSMKMKGRREFPEKIRLREFNEMVHETFKPSLAYDDYRGPLYLGIRFVK